MLLRVCVQCRRHVALSETACPFCRAALAPCTQRAPRVAARLGRAAIFAGATAVTGCWTSSTKAHDTNTVEHKTVETTPAAVPPGSIRGVVRNGETGQPLAGFAVTLVAEAGAVQQGVTDQKGEYVFTGLEPGNYTVTYQPSHPRQPPAEVPVTLHPEQGERADLSIVFPAPDRGPCCKPYGAPPARRRIV